MVTVIIASVFLWDARIGKFKVVVLIYDGIGGSENLVSGILPVLEYQI